MQNESVPWVVKSIFLVGFSVFLFTVALIFCFAAIEIKKLAFLEPLAFIPAIIAVIFATIFPVVSIVGTLNMLARNEIEILRNAVNYLYDLLSDFCKRNLT